MAGIETLLAGAAKAMKAGEALNFANIAGKALGMGSKKEESGGGSQGPDKSIEANRAGNRDEEMYLFLDALFGQLQTTDLSNEITGEERCLFGKFLAALTPAEANLVIGGVAKRESDIHIKEPVVLKMRRRNKQGDEYVADEKSFKDFTVKTNARGRSIVRGIAHHITEQVTAASATTPEAIADAEDAAITSLVSMLRHARLVRNAEDIGKGIFTITSEQIMDIEIGLSEVIMKGLLNTPDQERIKHALANHKAAYETAKDKEKKRLGKEYLETLFSETEAALKSAQSAIATETEAVQRASPPKPPPITTRNWFEWLHINTGRKRPGKWTWIGIGWSFIILASILTAWF